MRCSSVQRRLTSEARRLSTHFAFFPRSWRRSLACGRLLPCWRSAVFSGSSLKDFTGCRLPYSSGSLCSGVPGGGVSFGWVERVRYFGIGSTGASRQQAVLKVLVLARFFYRWIAVGAPGSASVC